MDTPETQDAENAWGSLEIQANELESELLPESKAPATEKGNISVPDMEIAELLGPAIKVTADIFAPNWELQEAECEQLGIVYGALLDKYLPDNSLSKFGVEISAIMVTGIILKTRVGKPMRIEKTKDKKPSDHESESAVKKQVVDNASSNGVLTPKGVKDDS
ncbi:hypothetical protein [Thalassotalea piscium]|uniref:Uncharacterized protein n=1 Tax=Thalassotalea piscium TaxID=1230533 RepID=A0A7X0NG56_9GAMM|nr:hypothetical protein [Thalassotalea piscium]MBB6542862.1 hypothetical protein [Thalassotalea piscium]